MPYTLLKIALSIILFCFLTALTQVGGLVYLLSMLAYKPICARTSSKLARFVYKFMLFLAAYALVTYMLVPIVAKPCGRVQLPISETQHLRPLNFWTCFLNRNYVRPELRQAAFEVATQMNNQYPETTINYLDANFPFFDGFPLLPHLSHSDGKKLDLSFCYRDSKTNEPTNNCPSAIGYGISEEPAQTEENKPNHCEERGFWQYNILTKVVPQGNKQNFAFDAERTKTLVQLFANNQAIGKIFIEPHLKTRMGLRSTKIRFHGCQAVRHDDHLHVQLP